MKRTTLLVIIAVFLFMAGCADNDKKAKNEEKQKAEGLLSTSRCLTCHSNNETINGPSYTAIAERYAGRADTIVPHLAKKIINGGSGEWGEIYMTPNPKVSQEDAEAMVKYILSLKK